MEFVLGRILEGYMYAKQKKKRSAVPYQPFIKSLSESS